MIKGRGLSVLVMARVGLSFAAGGDYMKKYFILPAVIIILQSTASFASVDLSIGGTAWYAWWKPAWSDAKTTSFVLAGEPTVFRENSRDFHMTSNAMAGPVVAIGFLDRWSIQSAFAIGRFKAYSRGMANSMMLTVMGEMMAALSYKKYSRDILKWDSDTSISCAVHRMVKIFAGFKAQGYRYEERLDDLLYAGNLMIIHRVLTDDVKAYGGGLGLGLTIPLGAGFYLMTNVSGLALWSIEKININYSKSYTISDNVEPLPVWLRKGRYFSYGGSAALSFAYHIEKISTTISLGGRYQILFNRQRYNNIFYNDVAMNIIDGKYDHFFGITMSAIYTFHIGKREG